MVMHPGFSLLFYDFLKRPTSDGCSLHWDSRRTKGDYKTSNNEEKDDG
jgi:hypothetical protein